ncbi:molybdenum cofactor guanylyltransferase [Sanguibacter sp. A247]|uniref:molybdenum cofactor guanylyltransferase n=1 Tax=unclassified Sanguibacter TaxID=2645534 RepID=UPI003FD6C5FE
MSGVRRQDVVIVVPAGGTARRLGGGDKTALDVGGRSILERVLDATTAWPCVVVADDPGPAVHARHPGVRWVREDPPGGGPAAALAAGVAAAPDARVLVALAGDQPWAGDVVPRLLAALHAAPEAEAALAVGGSGRRQPLLAAYRIAAVTAVLAGGAHGLPARALAEGLAVVEVPVTDLEVFDVDTPDDLAAARAIEGERGRRRGRG